MARNDQTLTDAEIVAFVDRRLPDAQRQRIVEMAGRDKELAARIALLTEGTPSLEASFQYDLHAVPPALTNRIRDMAGISNVVAFERPLVQDNRRRWLAGAAAMAASFAAGVFGGNILSRKSDPAGQMSGQLPGQMPGHDWREAVAQYHALYGRQTIERLNPTEDDKIRELNLVSQALGYPLQTIVSAATGYTYKRAQLLEFEGSPLVQVVFEAPGQIPVAFCLKRQRKISNGNVDVEQRLGMSLASWSSNGIDQLVVARLPSDAIGALAKRLFEV